MTGLVVGRFYRLLVKGTCGMGLVDPVAQPKSDSWLPLQTKQRHG